MKTQWKLRYVLLFCVAVLRPPLQAANSYVQTNLVSDLPGMAAQTDPNLINPWGLAASSSSPFWISDNHAGASTLYNGAGQAFPTANPLVVQVPAPANAQPPAAPTGVVFNDTAAFLLGGSPASFIFSSEDGTITAWNGAAGGAAMLMADNSGAGAIYKGLAIGVSPTSGPMIYATNFYAGTIDTFDGSFSPRTTPGGFVDPNLPSSFAPFGIQRIGRKLFVTYAMQDSARHDDVAGAGNGFIDVFDLDGNLAARLVSGGKLNSPWGLALSPAYFGDFGNVLLVGNFGDGTVNAFDPWSGTYLGTLQDPGGNPLGIPGLWALQFGNNHNGGDAETLYFTAGIPGTGSVEDHGLFGSIQAQ
jgi:uncharacterized protein (TIGR03118 family)